MICCVSVWHHAAAYYGPGPDACTSCQTIVQDRLYEAGPTMSMDQLKQPHWRAAARRYYNIPSDNACGGTEMRKLMHMTKSQRD